jgi:DNA-binding transcriptional LysR family regulator
MAFTTSDDLRSCRSATLINMRSTTPPAVQLRDLELKHLVALDAVAREGTFGKAASRLGYTQSAVSQQIAQLERLIGGALFDRPGGPRPVELTPLGKLVLEHAREVIERVEATGEAVQRFLAGGAGRIDIGTFQSVSNVLLPAMVRELRREHPDVDIRLFEEEDNDAGAQAVLAGELDLAFTIGHRTGDLESILLLEDPFVLVAPKGELPDGPFPTAQLDQAALVGYPPSSCQADVERGLRAVGAAPTFVFRTYDNGAQMAMVRAGMGWAVMPLLAVGTGHHDLDIRYLSPPIPARQICLVWRRDRTLSPVAARMVELAQQVAHQLAELPIPA